MDLYCLVNNAVLRMTVYKMKNQLNESNLIQITILPRCMFSRLSYQYYLFLYQLSFLLKFNVHNITMKYYNTFLLWIVAYESFYSSKLSSFQTFREVLSCHFDSEFPVINNVQQCIFIRSSLVCKWPCFCNRCEIVNMNLSHNYLPSAM